MAKDPVLDLILLWLSEIDPMRFRDVIEGGLFLSGGLGAGKSSTFLFMLAMAFLRALTGGLVLTVKSDETRHWIEYARRAGRENDLIIFNAESGLSFDPFAYLWQTGGRAAAQIETIVEIFTVLMSVGKVYSQSSGERYFEQAVEELMRAVLVVLANAGEPISITSMHNVVSSLPIQPEQLDNPEWQATSECSRLISRLKERKNSFSKSQWEDLDIAIVYLLEKWPNLDTRTRSNIESTWSGMASKFTYSPFREMFCSGRFDFTPEQLTHERKILIVDMPVLEYGRQTSRICQILIKLVFQRAWLRHQYKPGCCNGAFLFQDEFSFLMHRNESHFHSVCRGSGIAPICACQNILSIAAEEFGEQEPGAKTLGFLGLFAVKFFMANNETMTNNYAADQIGKQYRDVSGWNAGEGQSHSHFGVSANQQLTHLIEPIEFTRLMKPDGENPLAEAICYMSGRSFNATKTQQRPQGLPYLRVHFSRD
jgi:type IV secretory pathway TraG/TraD family ATPase VirD4